MKQLNWYQIFGKSNIPDGRTVLPTDDIQIWLNCANIWDKTYTTLAEVLADADTLLALISNNNAVDYMVRSTTWATQITVPTMTSNTTPSGVCSADYSESSTYPWKAFDKSNTGSGDYWSHYGNNNFPAWIQYKFAEPTLIDHVMIYPQFDVHLRAKSFVVKGSADGSNWTEMYSGVFPDDASYASENHFALSNTSDTFSYYRVEFTDWQASYAGWIRISEVNFYRESVCNNADAMTYIGQNNYASNTLLADATWREAICNSTYKTSVLNVTNPNMTDNTHPYGECFASSIYSSDYAEWKAFTGSINTRGWNCNSSEYNKLDQAYVGYEFTSAVKVCMIEFIYNTNSTAVSSSEVRVVANDNSADAWNVMSDVYTGTGTGQTERKIIVNSYAPYKRIALKGSFYQGQRYFQICKATIYGRKDI